MGLGSAICTGLLPSNVDPGAGVTSTGDPGSDGTGASNVEPGSPRCGGGVPTVGPVHAPMSHGDAMAALAPAVAMAATARAAPSERQRVLRMASLQWRV